MHERLVSYLRDNRDQIIERWLTEAEIPAPGGGGAPARSLPHTPYAAEAAGSADPAGVVPYAFFADAFEAILVRLGALPRSGGGEPVLRLRDFIGLTCACCARRQRPLGGRVCLELHDSGLAAFLSVFEQDWDTASEFNALDREYCADRINRAIAGLIADEINHCQDREARHDCPFAGTSLHVDALHGATPPP